MALPTSHTYIEMPWQSREGKHNWKRLKTKKNPSRANTQPSLLASHSVPRSHQPSEPPRGHTRSHKLTGPWQSGLRVSTLQKSQGLRKLE